MTNISTFPLSSSQREIWFDQALQPELPTYNIGGYVAIEGAVDRQRFEQALAAMVQRHDCLRTVLVAADGDDGVPRQRFAATMALDFTLHDVSALADPQAAALRWMQQRLDTPFALLDGRPLSRHALVKLADDCWWWQITMHHLVADGWSIALCCRSAADAYSALAAGAEPAAAAPSYADFVADDQRYRAGATFERHRRHWLARHADLLPPLFAPRHGALADDSAERSSGRLPRATYDALAALAQAHGGTAFHALLALLWTYFSRHAGRDELVLGLPILNRSGAVFKATGGVFVGVNAVRLALDADADFGAAVHAVARVLQQDYRHQRYPLAELQREVVLQRGSAQRLFDVSVSFERHDHSTSFAGARGRAVALVNSRPAVPLTLFVREFHADDDVEIDLVCSRAYFEAGQAQALRERLVQLVDQVLATPAVALRRLALATPADLARAARWNDTRLEIPGQACFHQLFEAQAARTPAAAAIAGDGADIGYADLNRRANRLARHLRECGVGPDARVAICAGHSAAMVTAVLAVAKAGGAYVPLDGAYPVARLAHMLADSAPVVLLCDGAPPAGLALDGLPQIDLQDDAAWAQRCGDDLAPAGIGLTARHLAYVIYTSGSTGLPKGVMVEHRGVVNLACGQAGVLGVGPGSRVLQFASFSFDACAWEIVTTLTRGGTLVLARDVAVLAGADLLSVLERQSITHATLTPSVLAAAGVAPPLPALQTLVVAGEACSAELVRRWAPGRRFINAYGPTEASVCATEHVCDPASADAPPIGRPVANARVYLLDDARQPVPPGAVGELWIGGAGVARGYLNRPELSAERFVADPFGAEAGARMYRTGDVGQQRADGSIVYLGRNDQQLKLRGFRIETGEIEARLLQHPAVLDAAVAARSADADAHADPGAAASRLVGYYTLRPGQAVEPAALRDFLAASLPEHMLPALLQALDAMPLTPNGKLDRAALPAPAALAGADFEAPVGELETTLAGWWATLLQAGPIGRGSHFFRLGGHSLLAVRLVSLLREALGVELRLAQVFAHPLLADMALAVAAASASVLPPLTPLTPLRRAGALPLSFAQQRLWFLAQLEGGSRAYHVAGGFRLRGTLRRDALGSALDRIVDRHESLRTSFAVVDGEPAQRIAPPGAGFALAEHDWRGRVDADAAAALVQLAADEADAPFDLEHGPLIRGRLVRLADDEHVLLLTMHHLVSDGWSMGVLVRELAALYAGAGASLPPLALQYADYAAWQRRWLEGDRLERQVAYWVERLRDAPALIELPTDRPRPLREDHAGAAVEVVIDAALTARLRALAARHGATLFMTLLGAWGLLMSRLSGQAEVVVGTAVAHRTRVEVEPLIGFFVNTLALRLDVAAAPDVGALLQRVKRHAVEAQDHQDLPFEQLVEILRPARSLAHNPIFQVMFAWQNFEAHDVRLDGLEVERLAAPHVTTLFDLKLELAEAGDGIAGTIEYATSLFDRASVDRMRDCLLRLLDAMADDDGRSVARLPLLPDTERRRILHEWNPAATDYDRERCLHELFEAQAARTPDAVAVSDGRREWSYAALDARADRLARALRDRGVGPDVAVALCVERSVEMVAAMLAVLKAGGCYVPLDPAYPAPRLAQMLADSRAAVLLSQVTVWSGLEAALAPQLGGATLLQLEDVDDSDAAAPVTRIDRNDRSDRGDLGPDHLAYIIYTSGSTGVPKGVCLTHRNAVNFVTWAQREFSADELKHTLLSTSLNFDLAVFETFVPLSLGATVHVVPNALALLERPLAVTLVNTVPSALEALLQQPQGLPTSVCTVNVAGEPLKKALVERLFERCPQVQRLCNLYGPSETTTYSTWATMTRASGFVGHVGRPVANTRVYLLDGAGQPVPAGVVGELHIGGDGVARGYLRRPELSAERFVADPFVEGGRLYRTGDLARHDREGHIEFLGRNDHQVKIRGYRIELGEIESRLAEHAQVREAVVVARDDGAARRLVAYVVCPEADSQSLDEHVAAWSDVWSETYEEPADAADDPAFDISGWNSSYTRAPIPRAEMRDWLDGQLARIAALNPRRVLEIGCGSGMIVLNLAPHCERYVGTDLAAPTVARLGGLTRALQRPDCRIELIQAQAADFSALPRVGYDTVILNSVVQYFPNLDYLQTVIEQAIGAIGTRGHIFVGDVRHYGLLEAFHLSVQIDQARPELPAAEVATRAANKLRSEGELAIDPAWFVALRQRCPDITRVRVLPKQAAHANEMSAYRYDVVLDIRTAASTAAVADIEWIDAADDDTAASLLARVAALPAAHVGVRGIANPLVRGAAAALAREHAPFAAATTAGALRAAVRAYAQGGVGVHALAQGCSGRGWALQPSWLPAAADGRWHALISKHGAHPDVDWMAAGAARERDPAGWANDPMRAERLVALPERLRAHLAATLPEFMLPDSIVELAALPRTPNGKLDRKALPAPSAAAAELRESDAPQGEVEAALARIWAEVLQRPAVGRHAHFFDLGGHSLLAVRVVALMRQTLGVEIGLGELFAQPVLAELAQAVKRSAAQALPALTPLAPAARSQPLPLSFPQQRLWFLSQLEGGSRAYHVVGGLRLRGTLDRAALALALDRIVERHESLRTRFVAVDGQPLQQVGPADVGMPLRVHDVARRADPEHELERLAEQEADAPFDLTTGPLIRARLVRLDADDHALLLTMHHIVSDGWSIGVLRRELAALYGAYVEGGDDPLPPLPLQYADFALWQRRWLDADVLQQQVAYWTGALDGAPALLELPTDRPRPAQEDHAGAAVRFALERPLSAALERLSRRHGTTLFMTLLGAFGLLMSRLSGQAEVVVGTPVANRGRAGVEPLIGFFVNTLALRVDCAGSPTVAELLDRVRQRAIDAQSHQDLPFEQLVDRLRPARSLAHNPLFQVMFAWQGDDAAPLALPGLALASIEMPHRTTLFDLRLDLTEVDGCIAGSLEYATALFDRATVERWLGHLRTLLAAMAADEHACVDGLPLLQADERGQLLQRWNDSAAGVPRDVPVHALFEAQARRTPAAPAAVDAETGAGLSYAELNARADVVALRLGGAGVRRGDRVALCVERGLALPAALLGAWKAGAAYVPLDPAHPPARLHALLQDCGATALLVGGGLADGVEAALRAALGAAVPCIDLDAVEALVAPCAVEPARADDVAYAIYTSGSTGRPKGVLVEHRSVVNLLCAMRDAVEPGPARVLALTTIAFDIAALELLLPLVGGGCCVIAGRATATDPQRLAACIEEHAVDLVQATPAGWRMLLDAGWAGRAGLKALCGGEALAGELAQRLAARVGTLWNVYGPTETTIWSSIERVPADGAARAVVPIGRPLANTALHVLDAQFEPLPIGVAGELWIGGAGVARGYLGRPELDAERFVADPFVAGQRLYRSGDLARRLADGRIEYLGRNDHQVKVRGYRIELGEVEAALLQQPGVRAAAVVVHPDGHGENALVAYVVGSAAPAALRAGLARVLPEHMLPASWLALDSLPLTPNGKVDRQALPAPDGARRAARAYEAPAGAVEAALAAVWADVLGVDRVGRHDDFFALGGHSLLAARAVERMRSQGLAASVRRLFARPTVAGLAASLGDDGAAVVVPPNAVPAGATRITPAMLPLVALDQDQIDTLVAAVPGGAANVQDIYPLAPLQQGILYHHRSAGAGADPYLQQALLAFDDRARLDAYLQALQALLLRHDVLRTSLHWDGLAEPVQVVWRQATLPVEELRPEGVDDVAAQLRSQVGAGRIELGQAPLLRLTVAADPAHGRWLALLRLHHLVGDDAALQALHAEMQALWAGDAAALPVPQPYRDYVALARIGVPAQEHEAFFRTLLGDVDTPTAPYGLVEVDGAAPRQAAAPVDAALAQRLRAAARAHGVGAASVFHLAWALVLARLADRDDDLVFGTVLSGRLHGGAGVERAVGLYANTLPLRVRLGDAEAGACLREVHAGLARLLRHEHAPLALAQRCSGVAAPLPLFGALLNCLRAHAGADTALPGVSLLAARGDTHYPLVLSVRDAGAAGFELVLDAVPPIDPERVCGYVLQALARLAEALESTTPCRVDTIEVLPAAERHAELVAANDTTRPYPRDRALHALVAERAASQPEAPAVVDGARTLNYRQLDRAADRLALRLQGHGVGAGDRVALLLERSAAWVVACLAVLKCGAAYVPFDRLSPPGRQRLMLADCGARVLVAAAGVDPEFAGTLPVVDPALDPVLDRARDEGGATPAVCAAPHAGDAPAYVMYTSGSTGEPKGVVVPHRAIARLVLNDGYADLGPDDRVAVAANPAFDAVTFELWGALLNGGCAVIVDQDTLLQPQRLRRLLADEAVSVLWLTVGLFNQLADPLADAWPRLRLLIVGGDALDPATIRRVLRRGAPQRLLNGYGPTETTTFALTHAVGALAADARSVPIGRPIGNTRVYLLDRQGRPVPRGVAGEICIGGDGVALGYLGRPALTAERFVADPHAGVDGARLYRSGDLGRRADDGAIEFLGRRDGQIKVRGFRVELGEIEACLLRHPGVREAVVAARDDGAGGKRLLAWWTARDHGDGGDGGAGVDAAVLRAHVAAALPEHMLPSAWQRLPALPLTANGKVDRRALPEPDAAPADAAAAPAGALEQTVAAAWAAALGRVGVGRHDDFFELGGHSLVALGVVERLRAAGLDADVRRLYAHPTVAALAASLAAGDGRAAPFVVPPNGIPAGCDAITPAMLPLVDLEQAQIDAIVATVPGGAANVQDIYPLAPLQQGILFHHLMAERGDTYLLHAAYAVPDRALLDAHLEALRAVVRRHDVLRTSFCWDGLPAPVQVVWREATLPVHEHAVDAADVAAALCERFDPRHHRIDLRSAPLLRVHVAADPAHGRWVLLLLLHHLAGDHAALDAVRHELDACRAGAEHRLPAPRPYREFVARARAGVPAHEHEAFFREMLGDVDEPTAPYGVADVHGDGALTASAARPLPAPLARRLRAAARAAGVGSASLFHLAWGLVLARLAGRADAVFGTVLFGRMDGAGEHAVGLYINTLPLRIDLRVGGAADGVQAVHRMLARLMRHEHAPLVLAQRCSAVAPGTPLFSALLNYRHSAPAAVAADTGLELLATGERTNYPLILSVDDLGDGYALDAQAVLPIDAQRICGYMEQALASLAQALEQASATPLRALAIVPPAERAQLLHDWNPAATDYDRERCLHELFEAQAARTPDAVAVSDGRREWSYAALDARADRLARALRDRGVGPDVAVALCVERSVEMVAAMLAVLKAGGCYVPLDPAYPAPRLAQMLADSRAAVLLSQATVWSGLEAALAPQLGGATLLQLEDVDDSDAAAPVTRIDRNDRSDRGDLGPDHLAYIIYTSGSTGVPKGVCLTHRNAVNFVTWAQREFSADELKHTLLSTSLNFDLAVFETFVPLSLGAAVHVVPNALALLERPLAVTLINTVPSALEALLQQPQGLPTSVCTVNVAGEPLKKALVERLFERCPQVQRLCNLYGPSETTTYSTWATMTRASGFVGHVGRPVANTRVYLLDGAGQPVPAGVVGELHIGGDGVARGYLHRPELSAERFVADPFVEGGRLYRTGDLARHDREGHIEFLGRNDHQVKIRGYRIELGEIESRLAEHAQVREAVVVARDDGAAKRLVAYVVGSAEPAALREHLRATLPEHMLPAAWVALERLPLTPNGKLDRAALPAPGAQPAQRAYEAPQGDVERLLARIWAEVLELDQVGRHDNFFELGGHSLLALGVMQRMRQAGLAADVRRLFSRPTVAALALAGDAGDGAVAVVDVPANPIAALHRAKSETPADDLSAPLLELRL